MERNQATAKPVAWPSCAWVLLSFYPFPVGHPEHEHCTEMPKKACPRYSESRGRFMQPMARYLAISVVEQPTNYVLRYTHYRLINLSIYLKLCRLISGTTTTRLLALLPSTPKRNGFALRRLMQ